MTKYLYTIISILAVALCMSVRGCTQAELKLKQQEQIVEDFNKAEKESVKTITKVREIIKNVKEDCDCYHQYIPDDVVKLLRKQ